MRKKNLWKKVVSCILVAGLTVSMTACGGKKDNKAEAGVANTDTVVVKHFCNTCG